MRFLLLVSCGTILNPAWGDTLNGTVKGQDGTIISSGYVTATPTFSSEGAQKNRVSVSEIRADGSFSFISLPVGAYKLCTFTPGTAWLNSCDWGGQGATTTLRIGQQAPPASLVLIKGAIASIRINDAGRLLATHEGRTAGAHFLLGIQDDSLGFVPAYIASQDSDGRTYHITAPLGRQVRLSFGSAFFQLIDTAGKVLPRLGNTLPINLPLAQSGSASLQPTLTSTLPGISKP